MRGFTLIELLISLAILALFTCVALPGLQSQINNNRLETTKNALLETVQLTRSTAVFRNQRVTLHHLDEGWERGWEVFIDSNSNGTRDEGEQLLRTVEPPAGNNVRIMPNRWIRRYVSFIGTGQSRMTGRQDGGALQAGTFKMCPQAKGAGYALILAPSGRMRVEPLSMNDCQNL